MRVISVIMLAGILSACGKEKPPSDIESQIPSRYKNVRFSTVCLDGISYWINVTNTDKGAWATSMGMLAVKINPETLKPEKCEN